MVHGLMVSVKPPQMPSCVTLILLNIAAHPPQNTFFTELAPTLKMPLFTVSLNYRAPGFYDFGFVDKRKYSGPLRYFPVPQLPTQSLWGVNATGYAIGDNQALKAFDGGNLPTFIDSGGAFIFLPPKVCDEYYAQAPFAEPANLDINRNGNPMAAHLFPCSKTLPDLVIAVGDYQTTIPGLLLQGSQYNATSKLRRPTIDWSSRTVLIELLVCVSNLIPSGGASIPSTAALFGLPFLRTTFAVFRNEQNDGPSVGLARKPMRQSYVDRTKSN